MDIGGPYRPGFPLTDRVTTKQHWPRYMLVGAFIPFSQKEATARYEQEVRDSQAAGIQGPIQLELVTKPGAQTLYFVECIPAKSDAPYALVKMVNRITNQHKCKAVYRIHVDRALELTGSRAKQMLEYHGVTVTSTAGHDSNANGRAERAVLWFQEKARTLLSSRIRSEVFQKQLLSFWTFAVQHVGEVHRKDVFG